MQKIILILAFFLASVSIGFAQDTYKITVEITNIKSNDGKIFAGLYNSEKTFLKKRFRSNIVKIENNKATLVFKDVPAGEYAISLFQDENNNKKMDTKIFGIPKEPYAFSNNAKGFMGPPSFKDSKFNITKNTNLTIKM